MLLHSLKLKTAVPSNDVRSFFNAMNKRRHTLSFIYIYKTIKKYLFSYITIFNSYI